MIKAVFDKGPTPGSATGAVEASGDFKEIVVESYALIHSIYSGLIKAGQGDLAESYKSAFTAAVKDGHLWNPDESHMDCFEDLSTEEDIEHVEKLH